MMQYDVLALQSAWGLLGYNVGDTTYSAMPTDTVDVIWDTGGGDHLDGEVFSNDLVLDLRERGSLALRAVTALS